jgi:hypothetical protein
MKIILISSIADFIKNVIKEYNDLKNYRKAIKTFGFSKITISDDIYLLSQYNNLKKFIVLIWLLFASVFTLYNYIINHDYIQIILLPFAIGIWYIVIDYFILLFKLRYENEADKIFNKRKKEMDKIRSIKNEKD